MNAPSTEFTSLQLSLLQQQWNQRHSAAGDIPALPEDGRFYVRGHFAHADMHQLQLVAVVGARAATPYGTHIASQLGARITEDRSTVIASGGHGIAAHALRGALNAGGTPIIVTAAGPDALFPVAHQTLFDQILEAGGAIVSAFPPGSTPTPTRRKFTQEVLGMLANSMTILVEASSISGSLATVHAALERHRPVQVVPGPITSFTSEGSNALFGTLGVTPLTSIEHWNRLPEPVSAGYPTAGRRM